MMDDKKRVVLVFKDGSSKKMKAKLIKALEVDLGLEVEVADTFNEKMYHIAGAWALDNANMEKEIRELSGNAVFYKPYRALLDLQGAHGSMILARVVGGMKGHKYTTVFDAFAQQMQDMLGQMNKICDEEDEILRTIQDRHDRPYESKGS